MTSIKILTATAALLLGASQLAMAAEGNGAAGASPAATATQNQPSGVNGQQTGTGPNAKEYGTKQHMGREQPEAKQDMGSGAGK